MQPLDQFSDFNSSKNSSIIDNESNHPRSGWIAFFLSLFTPELGQVYNGQWKKGALFFCLLLLIPLFFRLTQLVTYFYPFIVLLLIHTTLRIWIFIDAVIQAKRLKNYSLKEYNRWYYLLLIGIGMISILWVADMNTLTGVQSFHIPTTSMSPTVEVGDYIIADMDYNSSDVKHGDLVVHRDANGVLNLRRVVGLPNDQLEIVDNFVTINGQKSKTKFIRDVEEKGVTINNKVEVEEYEETLVNGAKYQIYKYKTAFDHTKTTIRNITVPPNHYYMLGDNRDHSLDSRYEGAFPAEDIMGCAAFTWWGASWDRVGIDLRNSEAN